MDLVELIRAGTAEEVEHALADAEPNALMGDGESPLVAACEVGRLGLVRTLLKAGASADAQSSSGLSALGTAAMVGHLEVVRALLTAGATVDLLIGRQRSTALSYAAQEGHRAVCHALLDAGADARLPDAYGMTPVEYAERAEDQGRHDALALSRWSDRLEARASAIDAEPAPSRPPFPRDLKAGVVDARADPSVQLWQPGVWLHQKQPPSQAVLDARRPRDFSATGYNVSPPAFRPEDSTLTGEEMARTEVAAAIDEDTHRAVALERSERNPHEFNDDVPSAKAFVRAATLSAADALRKARTQEGFMGAEYPGCPTRAAGAPLYGGRVQGAHVCVPTAAASLVPVLDHYGEFEPLAEMLRRGVEKPQPEELEGEGQGGEAKA